MADSTPKGAHVNSCRGSLLCCAVVMSIVAASLTALTPVARAALGGSQAGYKAEIRALRAQLHRDAHTIGSLEGRVRALHTAERELQRTDTTLARDNRVLTGTNATLTDENTTLTGQNATLTSQNTALTSEISSAETEVGGSGDLMTRLSAVSRQIDGPGATGSLSSQLSALDAQVLTNPSGDVQSDLVDVAGQLVGVAGPTLESDVDTLNTNLGVSGTTLTRIDWVVENMDPSVSNAQTAVDDIENLLGAPNPIDLGSIVSRIGNPTVNGASSTLTDMIGGTGNTLAARLGDPVTGGSGLASLIDAASATNNNSVFSTAALSSFSGATDLATQLSHFDQLFDTGSLANNADTKLTLSLSGTAPGSLGALVGDAASTS